MAGQSVQGVSGFVSIEAAAAELGIAPMGVKRLIARERLAAARLGDGGPWRIAGAELARYIAASAPDLKGPPTEGSWFDNGEVILASTDFQSRVLAMVPEDQIPKVAPSDVNPQVTIEATLAMRAVADRPAARNQLRKPAQQFPDAFTAYAVHALRAIARKLIGRYTREGGLARLYSDPASYAEIAGEAMNRFAADGLRFSRMLPSNPKKPLDTVRVSFLIQHAEFLTNARRVAAPLLAF